MKLIHLLLIAAAPTVGILAVRPMVQDAQFWAAYHEERRSRQLVELAAMALFPNDLGSDQGTAVSYATPQSKAGAPKATPASQPWKSTTFSVYSDYYDGRSAADGSKFDQTKYTCASNSHKLGTKLDLRVGRVTLRNVPVTDRMAKRFTGVRIDLSRAAWDDLTFRKAPGLAKGEWRVAK